MDVSDDKFEHTKRVAEDYYKSIDAVHCPYLNTEVHFNRTGFEHLLYKSWNRGRSRVDQYQRLRLIRFSEEILKKSHTLQEYDVRKMFVRCKINNRWEKRMMEVRYYVFVATFVEKEVRFKVVVKQEGEAPPFFYSLYPSWKVVTNSIGKNQKKLFLADPELV